MSAATDDAAAVIAHLARFGTATETIARSFGGVELVLHAVPPRDDDDDDEPAWTLFTTGMSTPSTQIAKRTELIARLPADWQFDAASWPVRWLELLARVPHERNVQLGLGDTIPNGDPPRAFAADTALCCMMLVVPTCLADGEDVIASPAGAISLIALMPIYREEMQLKLDAGADELLARLDAAELDETFALARRNVATSPTSTGPKIRHSKRR